MDEAFSLFGDRILVLHAKDFRPGAPGAPELETCPAGSGNLDYAHLFSELKRRKPGLDILIEDLKPEAMDAAAAFIRESWAQA
jgi:sugar phosphate isomerase/epimerase